MRTVLTIAFAALALAGLLGGSALRGGDGATLALGNRAAPAAQDGDFVSPREAVILAQRINELEERVAELEARALPPLDPPGEYINWTYHGFNLTCHWLPVAADAELPGPGETRHGACVRKMGPQH